MVHIQADILVASVVARQPPPPYPQGAPFYNAWESRGVCGISKRGRKPAFGFPRRVFSTTFFASTIGMRRLCRPERCVKPRSARIMLAPFPPCSSGLPAAGRSSDWTVFMSARTSERRCPALFPSSVGGETKHLSQYNSGLKCNPGVSRFTAPSVLVLYISIDKLWNVCYTCGVLCSSEITTRRQSTGDRGV